MHITIMHANGKVYRMEVSQAVVYADNGEPCAISYEHGGLIIHTDKTKDDFDNVIASLRIENMDLDG